MKILELSVQHVRGIHDIDLDPNGENLLIWGPNGAGKSAIVDAVDFLLTGEISRLTGEGTGGLSLKAHGPHIDYEPSTAAVAASVRIQGVPEPIQISRCMGSPKELVCDPAYIKKLRPALEAARQHQHILSRRELLRFITAEPSTRAEGIQELLSLSPIEKVRSALVKLRNESQRARKAEEKSVETAKLEAAAMAGADKFGEDEMLSFANKQRAVLGAPAIKALRGKELRSEIVLPKAAEGGQSINITALNTTFSYLQDLLGNDTSMSIAESDARLRLVLDSIRDDERKTDLAARHGLFRAGLPLVPETGECPLCDAVWPEGELRQRLEERIVSAEAAATELQEVDALVKEVKTTARGALSRLPKAAAALEAAGLPDDSSALRSWVTELEDLVTCLESALDKYPGDAHAPEAVARLVSKPGFADRLAEMQERAAERFPAATPEQAALEALTQLEVSLGVVEQRESDLEDARTAEAAATALHDCFVAARDSVLGALYDEICERFSMLYRELHSGDEGAFSALLEPAGAGLRLEVDFFGRGEYPPHALHSEGHQDSMGLCLYLALAEHLVGDSIELTVLDDVVMSVDSEHRRGVCNMLGKYFPDQQFLITTHDKTWMNQLRSSGLVRRKNVWEFYRWDIDTGPHVNLEPGLWDEVDERLACGDVSGASARLRRGSEQFFSFVCDSLGARVRFSLEGRYDLGDLLPAAVGRFMDLLKSAAKAAKSWEKEEEFAVLQELGTTLAQIYKRTNAERWPMNPAVHYTAWANLCREDFEPVKEAFQDLHGAFVCQKPECGAVLRVERQGVEDTAVRCKCGDVYWNLVKNRDESN